MVLNENFKTKLIFLYSILYNFVSFIFTLLFLLIIKIIDMFLLLKIYLYNFYYLITPNFYIKQILFYENSDLNLNPIELCTKKLIKIISSDYKNINWETIFILYSSINNNENTKIYENSLVEIIYILNNIQYRVLYSYKNNKKILFPLYDIDEFNDYDNNIGFRNGILHASHNNKDITELIKEYAGPKNNFYSDKNINLLYNHIIHDNKDLLITDKLAEDYVFNNDNNIIKINYN